MKAEQDEVSAAEDSDCRQERFDATLANYAAIMELLRGPPSKWWIPLIWCVAIFWILKWM